MEKHLTLREPSDVAPFSEAHLAALQEGANRRKKEQIVGNWIRITNPALFAQLLNEAESPRVSPTLNALDKASLFASKNSASADASIINPYAVKGVEALNDAQNSVNSEAPTRPNPPAGTIRTEGEMPQYRRPPPQLNIT